jgi:hypothetical protein
MGGYPQQMALQLRISARRALALCLFSGIISSKSDT